MNRLPLKTECCNEPLCRVQRQHNTARFGAPPARQAQNGRVNRRQRAPRSTRPHIPSRRLLQMRAHVVATKYDYLRSLTSVYSASTTFSSPPLPSPPPPCPAPPAPPPAAPACACCCAYIASPSFCDAVISASDFACSASFVASLSFSRSSASFSADSMRPFSSAPTFSPYSPSDLRTL